MANKAIEVKKLIEHSPFELSETDKAVLQILDGDFVPHSWEDLKTIIAQGDLSLLRRSPRDLYNYILWTHDIRMQYGSVLDFIMQTRLHWTLDHSQPPRFSLSGSIPFDDSSDFRILRNDWPYALVPGMVHLVVWSKIPIPKLYPESFQGFYESRVELAGQYPVVPKSNGGWFIRHMLKKYGNNYAIVCFDNLDYCSSLHNFSTVQNLPNFHFVKGDVCNPHEVQRVLKDYPVDAIVHLAAKSHVDNSFNDPLSFTTTNVLGTQVLLEACRKQGSIQRFIHVSTDEVYGENDYSESNPFAEDQILKPTNPYSATKAAAEMIIQGYQKSFHVPIIITRCNNVFGPYQYPEKLISKFITLLSKGQPLPVHGDGQNIRAFLFAADAAEALDTIFHKGSVYETYNISSGAHLKVLGVAQKVIEFFHGCEQGDDISHWVEMVEDRPYNDDMYWTDATKLIALGWKQRTGFDEGLEETKMMGWLGDAELIQGL
ncbi:uncharacterized protein N7459_009516 [Penicillium hispanicum]|uniref:uncharacterized protein n=1 Tax=Penicillium hispanicum TaxID=1080232 RepID=UPI00254005F4|nr:uncharacterized protein N7459_009516 [Penicillium hispanicum]KAJ5570086.1 hypothetical protein N7459_009516 [Penicillium hispanicum]